MSCMRTTLTIDDDVAQLIEDTVHRDRRPRKQVVNEALRRALTPHAERQQPYHLAAHDSAVQPGFDPSGFNRLSDELEDDTIIRSTQHAA